MIEIFYTGISSDQLFAGRWNLNLPLDIVFRPERFQEKCAAVYGRGNATKQRLGAVNGSLEWQPLQAEGRVMDAKTVLILALGVVVLLTIGFCALPT